MIPLDRLEKNDTINRVRANLKKLMVMRNMGAFQITGQNSNEAYIKGATDNQNKDE